MVTRVTDAQAVVACTPAITIVEADELGAVFPAEAGDAHAAPIHTEAITVALAGTCAFSTVLTHKPFIAMAGAIHAPSTFEAVFGARQFRAVKAGPGFVAHTDPILTVAALSAVVEALCFRAVFAKETI